MTADSARSPGFYRGCVLARTELIAGMALLGGAVSAQHLPDGLDMAAHLPIAGNQIGDALIAVQHRAVIAPAQRIFIAHGRHDQILPFQVAQKDIAGLLIANGLKPEFRPFDGDRRIDNEALADGLAYALGGAARRSGL